jgi:transposase
MLTNMPSKEELIPYIDRLAEAAISFNKSTRTIRRWLARYDLYQPQVKYKPGKVTKEIAAEIRRLDRENMTQTEIAKIIGISQPMVGRVINKGLKLSGNCLVNFNPKI